MVLQIFQGRLKLRHFFCSMTGQTVKVFGILPSPEYINGCSVMKKGKVSEIIVPPKKGLALDPCLTADDQLTHAVTVMLKHDLDEIAVTRNLRPIGMICLKDALKKLGLDFSKIKNQESKH